MSHVRDFVLGATAVTTLVIAGGCSNDAQTPLGHRRSARVVWRAGSVAGAADVRGGARSAARAGQHRHRGAPGRSRQGCLSLRRDAPRRARVHALLLRVRARWAPRQRRLLRHDARRGRQTHTVGAARHGLRGLHRRRDRGASDAQPGASLPAIRDAIEKRFAEQPFAHADADAAADEEAGASH